MYYLVSREMDCYEINDIESVKKLLSPAEDEYDYIFIDCPPVEIVADASIINKYSDLTLFIIVRDYLTETC